MKQPPVPLYRRARFDKKLLDKAWQATPEEYRRKRLLCLWATEVLRRKCPVYW